MNAARAALSTPRTEQFSGGGSMTRQDWTFMAVIGLICAAVAIVLGPLTGDMIP